jgi:hypothetical protein
MPYDLHTPFGIQPGQVSPAEAQMSMLRRALGQQDSDPMRSQMAELKAANDAGGIESDPWFAAKRAEAAAPPMVVSGLKPALQPGDYGTDKYFTDRMTARATADEAAAKAGAGVAAQGRNQAAQQRMADLEVGGVDDSERREYRDLAAGVAGRDLPNYGQEAHEDLLRGYAGEEAGRVAKRAQQADAATAEAAAAPGVSPDDVAAKNLDVQARMPALLNMIAQLRQGPKESAEATAATALFPAVRELAQQVAAKGVPPDQAMAWASMLVDKALSQGTSPADEGIRRALGLASPKTPNDPMLGRQLGQPAPVAAGNYRYPAGYTGGAF